MLETGEPSDIIFRLLVKGVLGADDDLLFLQTMASGEVVI